MYKVKQICVVFLTLVVLVSMMGCVSSDPFQYQFRQDRDQIEKVEICAFKNGTWLRVAGVLEEDDRIEAKKSMLDAYSNLRDRYNENDDNTQVLYLKSGTATFSSFTSADEVIAF